MKADQPDPGERVRTAVGRAQGPALPRIHAGEGRVDTAAARSIRAAGPLGIALLVALFALISASAAAQVQPGQDPELGTIAFVRHVAGADEIVLVRADGSGLRRLARLPRSAKSQLAWAPDGTRIGVLAQNNGRPGGALFVLSLSDPRLRKLAPFSPGADIDRYVPPPDWAPDGTSIAYSDGRNVSVVQTASGAPRRLNPNHAVQSGNAWSPSGRQIAFDEYRMSDGGGQPASIGWLSVIDAAGRHVTHLAHNAWNESDPTWSPDGRAIAYTGYRDCTQPGDVFDRCQDGLYVVRVADKTKRRLVAKCVCEAVWSPDGRSLAFADSSGGIALIRADGSGLKQVAATGSAPAWSPDGRTLTFERRENSRADIYVVDLASGTETRVVRNPQSGLAFPDADPHWRPPRRG
jgi:Tol biopolymer transport system component